MLLYPDFKLASHDCNPERFPEGISPSQSLIKVLVLERIGQGARNRVRGMALLIINLL